MNVDVQKELRAQMIRQLDLATGTQGVLGASESKSVGGEASKHWPSASASNPFTAR